MEREEGKADGSREAAARAGCCVFVLCVVFCVVCLLNLRTIVVVDVKVVLYL